MWLGFTIAWIRCLIVFYRTPKDRRGWLSRRNWGAFLAGWGSAVLATNGATKGAGGWLFIGIGIWMMCTGTGWEPDADAPESRPLEKQDGEM
jgi:hypothetical protein